MVREVSALGLETCATLGMLTPEQALELKEAGLDYYNHNLDTFRRALREDHHHAHLPGSSRHPGRGARRGHEGVLRRNSRLGESELDRAKLLHTLATLPEHPESVPINSSSRSRARHSMASRDIDPLEFVRTIAVARILMPKAHVRLSAGRTEMSDELQALCFLAGANSIFYGEKLLTTGNPDVAHDQALFARLGVEPEPRHCVTALEDLRARDLYRRRRMVQHWPPERGGALAIVEGQERLVFCSNDYLGLAHHPRVIDAFREAAARFGVGSGASHLVTGHGVEHHALEEELAAFTGRERALLFSTGYMANLGVVSDTHRARRRGARGSPEPCLAPGCGTSVRRTLQSLCALRRRCGGGAPRRSR